MGKVYENISSNRDESSRWEIFVLLLCAILDRNIDVDLQGCVLHLNLCGARDPFDLEVKTLK